MAIQTLVNFSAPVVYYSDNDDDVFDRVHVANIAINLDALDGTPGHGVPYRRLAGDVTIQDAGVNHSYRMVVSDLVADRNITLPPLGAADTFVFENHAQTLTSKTLTSPVINTPATSGGTFTNPTFAGSVNFDGAAEINSVVMYERAGGGDAAIQTRVSGDSWPRWQILAFGQMEWGSGSGAFDVILSRSAASTLTLTGSLAVTSALTVTGAITGSSTVQGTRLISTQATGTAPLTVSSTTLVTNLNADRVDNYHAGSPTAPFNANELVVRNTGGYIFSGYFNMTADQDGAAITRMAAEFNTDGYLRWFTAGRVIDFLEGADGAGSGLDADLVDGSHASAFATSGHGHDGSTITDQGLGSREINLTVSAAAVDNSEATSSTSFTDLTTFGPSVTVTPGIVQDHMIHIDAYVDPTTVGQAGFAGCISAGHTGAADYHSVRNDSDRGMRAGVTIFRAAVANGTQHYMQYRVSAGTTTFAHRSIIALAV